MATIKLIRITTVPISLDKLLGHQLEFMNRHYQVTAVSSERHKLREVAAKYGVAHHHVEMTRRITPLRDLKAVWKLYRFLKTEKPHIVHTHTPKAGIVGMLAAWLAGVPHRLHTVAGMPLMEARGMKRKILDVVETLTYKAATHVYPNSRGLQDFILENRYTSQSKLKVIGNGSSNGINTEYFSQEQIGQEQRSALRAKLKISENDFVFIFVGRLVGHKGVNELVHAFTELSSPIPSQGLSARESGVRQDRDTPVRPGFPLPQSPRFKLLLVGPLEHDLDALSDDTLSKIEHHPDISSVGYQQDVRAYFAVSNALVLPSYREGFPNAVLQAGAMGLPAIVSDINGCNEIITHGHNGLIVPVKSKEALRLAMVRLSTDPDLFSSLQEQSRAHILQHYREEQLWKAILAEYKTLAST